MSSYTATAAQSATRQGVTAVITGMAVILALLVLFAVFVDQGQLLSPALGQVSMTANYLHELAHDGRHLLGAPCH